MTKSVEEGNNVIPVEESTKFTIKLSPVGINMTIAHRAVIQTGPDQSTEFWARVDLPFQIEGAPGGLTLPDAKEFLLEAAAQTSSTVADLIYTHSINQAFDSADDELAVKEGEW